MADDLRRQRLERFAALERKREVKHETNDETNDENVSAVAQNEAEQPQQPGAPEQPRVMTQPLIENPEPAEAAVGEPMEIDTPAEPEPSHSWFHKLVLELLPVSLVERPQKVHLPGLRQELRDANRLDIEHDDLPSLFYEFLTSPTARSLSPNGIVFKLLFQSFSVALRISRRCKGQDEKLAAIEQIKQMLVEYGVVLSTSSPGDEMYSSLCRAIQYDLDGCPWEYVEGIICEAQEQEVLPQVLLELFMPLSKVFVRPERKFRSQQLQAYIIALRLFNIGLVSEQLPELPEFLGDAAKDTPRNLETTIFGSFFAMPCFTQEDHANIARLMQTNSEQSVAVSECLGAIGKESSLVRQNIFDLVYKLVRSSPQNRTRILDFMVRTINANKKRVAMQRPPELSSESFMLNMLFVCIRLCEPFLQCTDKNLDKVDPYYYCYDCSYKIEDETRVILDLKEGVQFQQENKRESRPNFITEIFFITAGLLYYGLEGSTIQEENLARMIEQSQQQLEGFRQRAANMPMMANSVAMLERRTAVIKTDHALMRSILTDDASVSKITEFTMFALIFALRQADNEHSYPSRSDLRQLVNQEPGQIYKYLPEHLVEACISGLLFIGRTNPKDLFQHKRPQIAEAIVVFLRLPQFIRNPYLKSKMVEVLYCGIRDQPMTNGTTMPGFFSDELYTNKFALAHLFHALMKLYVDMEQTGRSSQFYDKFNTREIISLVMKQLWKTVEYQQVMVRESTEDPDNFVRFVALLLNDSTYLLDEALGALQKIHHLQTEIESGNQSTDGAEGAENPVEALRSAERGVKSHLQLGRGTIEVLQAFTGATPSIFVTPEIVDRLAEMLNYYLAALVGPKCRELKVRDPEQYGWNPRSLLTLLISVYLNLAKEPEFIRALARDGRSYNPEHFKQSLSILARRHLVSEKIQQQWQDLGDKVEQAKREEDLEEEDLGEIPDEFLDPLMFTLMRQPVMLPASKVVLDLKTIKGYLLSDPMDPFNRQPLKIEDVIPCDELKAKIDAFVASKIGKQAN